MIRKTLLLLPFLLFGALLSAQSGFGLRLGMSTTEINPDDITIFQENGLQDLRISVENANYGLHAGLYFRLQMKKFFIQPEVLLNTNKTYYKITEFDGGEVVDDFIRDETYRYLDIPFILGFKFGPLRLQGGPVGHVFLSSNSELTNIEGYDQRFQEMTYGWQAGIGLDIWRFLLDLKFEGNFTEYGDHIRLFGNDYDFDTRPGRFLVTLGYRITKGKK